ncbi:MAG TPA: ATP-binding protein [Candidatus Acidoferrum sp.]|jgi:hypothetical protein
MSFGFVNGKDIENLNPDNLRKILNAFFEAEANTIAPGEARLDLSLRNYDPDGGVDARIRWPSSVLSETLLPGENVLQFKAEKLTLKKLENELSKPGVKQTLGHGGNYIVCVGHDYNPTDGKKWRSQFYKLLRQKRIAAKRGRILFGSDIAREVSRYPSVIVMPELAKDIPLFLTVDRWSRQKQHALNWKPDPARLDTIERIRAFVPETDARMILRVEGPAGVGKTRVTLEAVKEAGIAERTIYVPNSDDPHLTQLLGSIVGNRKAHAVIVADECSIDAQNILRSYADASGGRAKLVCVGTPDLLSPRLSASHDLVHLAALPDEQIRAVLGQIPQLVPHEIIDTAVRVAKGFVKLAVFVVQQLLEQKDLDLLHLSQIGDVGDFLRRFIKPEIREVLQTFSLLARVGWKENLLPEATAVAAYLGIPISKIRSGVSVLRNQGVLMEQGRYLYVTPDLLAIFAASQLWEEQGSDLINIIAKLPGREPCIQLLRRLAAMGTHAEIRDALGTLLGSEGLYKNLGDLDDEFRSEMFRILSAGLPDAATETLERVIAKLAIKDLLDFKRGRRNVMWAIESLLRWPSTSIRAARILRSLALAENETIGNNAVGIFSQYFQVYLSSCPLSLTDRLPLVDELISLGTPEARALAVTALESALKHDSFRMGGNIDELSGQPYPEEWRPRTWEELWSSRREALTRLRQIARGSDEASKRAQETLVGSVFTLIRDGIPADAIATLEGLNPNTDAQKREILDAAKRIEREVGERLSAQEKERLNAISQRTFDRSFSGRLRRWVGHRIHADYDLAGGTGFDAADVQTRKLAEEAYESDVTPGDLEWLSSREAENVWLFGQRLGELDTKSDYIMRLINNSTKDTDSLLIASYLTGQATLKGQDFRESILDDLSKKKPMLAFSATWRGSPSPRGLLRILGLVDSGAIAPETLGYLIYGGWTLSFSSKEIAELLVRMLRAPSSKILDPAMGIALRLLERDPNALDGIEELAWRMIEVKPERNWTWEWERIAAKLGRKDPQRLTRTIVSFFDEEGYLAPPEGDEKRALTEATKQNPEVCWQIIGDALLKLNSASHRLMLALKEWYGELIPTHSLIEWARAHPPKGPGIVAQLIAVKASALPERARSLFINFPHDRYVSSTIISHLISGFWAGPRSGRLQYEIEIAQGWTKDSDPRVREFARELTNDLKTELKHQLVREEEGNLI